MSERIVFQSEEQESITLEELLNLYSEVQELGFQGKFVGKQLDIIWDQITKTVEERDEAELKEYSDEIKMLIWQRGGDTK